MGLLERPPLRLTCHLAEICETKFCMSGASEGIKGLRIKNLIFDK
jgi:hypothetical protein